MKNKLLSVIILPALLANTVAYAALSGSPDSVADYLCIGSQYTNKAFGKNPNAGIVSLGNFGGYITYFFEEPLTDAPDHLYGIDFYVTGNSEEVNTDSLAEPGQVYVSPDGAAWYALAGSEHYEDKALWDYTITYIKNEDNTSAWADNYSGSMDYDAPEWPDPEIYTLNSTGNKDSYRFTGVLLKAQDGSIYGDGTADAYAARTSFGYVDYYESNIKSGKLIETDPYIASPARSNGFDLAWAVDGDGLPVDLSNTDIHYIRVATASNIYAGGFKEKSTEVTGIFRSPQCSGSVGKTAIPDNITVSYGDKDIAITPDGKKQIYDVHTPRDCRVSVSTTAENTYINNTRTTSKESFPKGLVRIITQSGDMEPSIVYLRLTDEAEATAKPTQTPEPSAAPTAAPTQEPESGSHSEPRSISVSFALYGDKRHGENEKHIFKNDRSRMPAWIPARTYTVPADSTVLYLFERALTEAGLDWTASGKNYISTINGLSEFDNGETSGWMYLINGDHAEVGIADRKLRNGDRIVFHYTDDYTAEQGSERYTRGGRTDTKAAEATDKKTDILILHEHEHSVMKFGKWRAEL